MENLDAGQEFRELPDTYIIFITESDFYGEGQAVYQIQRMNLMTGKPFDDGTYILYVNGEYRGDDELGKLMYDFNCTDADDMNYELMAERTRYLKKDPEGVRMMCKAMEDMRDKARAEGRTEGMNLFALLIKRLSELGRTEDIEKAAVDAAYRNQLLTELSIQ